MGYFQIVFTAGLPTIDIGNIFRYFLELTLHSREYHVLLTSLVLIATAFKFDEKVPETEKRKLLCCFDQMELDISIKKKNECFNSSNLNSKQSAA